jgi:diguanylate cyclase (GGDEF)-like protein
MQSLGQSVGVVDLSAIVVTSSAIGALLGLFLIIIWLQERDTRAFAWWGAAYMIGASAIALTNAPRPLIAVPASLSGVLIFTACGMVWNGVRLFHGRSILLSATFGGAFVWLMCLQIPQLAADAGQDRVIGAGIVGAYTFCIAWELWRERRKSLFSRAAAIGVPLMHGGMFIAPISLRNYNLFGSHDGWLVIFALETMIYSVGAAFIVLLMVKDHHVEVQRTAASTDPLTGLLNRRAFFSYTAALYARQRRGGGKPVTLMMFDLDKFKRINDTFGHAMGDEILRLFSTTLRGSMRADDIIARLGGEEIAAIVPADEETTLKIAERVRANFQKAGAFVGNTEVNSTVSIGVAATADASESIEALMARGDAALYRAKSGGRNRVCAAMPDEAAHGTAETGPAAAAQTAPPLVPDLAFYGHA